MLTNKHLTQSIINAIPNPIVVTDGISTLISNQHFLEFFNMNNLKEFLEKRNCVSELFQEQDGFFSLSSINKDILWTDYIYKSGVEHKVSIKSHENHSYVFDLSVKKINDHYLIVLTNITAKEQERYLKSLAYNDHLTQIYNRQMFDKLFTEQLSTHRRFGYNLSLIMFDIDYFKRVNDTFGHSIGDRVLISISKIIKEKLRSNDIFARYGGEEFIILLPQTNSEDAYKKAYELKELINENQDNSIPNITASFGLTELTNDDDEYSAFLRVDKALYEAKKRRNDIVKL